MVEPRYSLATAAAHFFKGGRVNGKSLARAVRMGRLKAEAVSGQYWVTESAIADYLKACEVKPEVKSDGDHPACPEGESPRGSTCANSAPENPPPSGLSVTERKRRAQAQALMTLNELLQP